MAKNKPKNLDKKYKKVIGKESLERFYIENKVVYAKSVTGAVREFRKLMLSEIPSEPVPVEVMPEIKWAVEPEITPEVKPEPIATVDV